MGMPLTWSLSDPMTQPNPHFQVTAQFALSPVPVCLLVHVHELAGSCMIHTKNEECNAFMGISTCADSKCKIAGIW